MSFRFATGDTLELHMQIGTNEQIFRTLIDQVSSDRDFVIYTPLHQGKVLLTADGHRFKVVFYQLDTSTSRYEIYAFQAQLDSRIQKDGVALWRITRVSDFEKLQRRDYFRLNYVKLMEIALDQRDNIKLEVLSKDISAGGMRCVVAQKLTPGEPVTCRLDLDPQNPIYVLGEIVSAELMPDSKLKYDTRIRFSGSTKKQQTDLIRQINNVQSEYLKKVATQKGEDPFASVSAHIDLKRTKQKIEDDRFDVKLGYWMGLELLLILLMCILYFAARPVVEFPVARFNEMIIRSGWNEQILYGNIGVSALVLFVSFSGILIDRNRYSGRRPINVVFLVGCFLGLLSLMVLTTLFATVFNTASN